MDSLDITLFWVGFWIYLASFISFTIYSASRKRMVGVVTCWAWV